MTCRQADKLMEAILNGYLAEDDESLRGHLSHCEGCAEVWHTARRVTSALKDDDVLDPGEAYFTQATASIMERVSAIAATEQPAAREDAATVADTMRHGPLSIRGIGVALFLVASFFADGFGTSTDCVRPCQSDRRVRDAWLVPAPACDDAQTLPFPVEAAHAGKARQLGLHGLHAGKHLRNALDRPLTPTSHSSAKLQPFDSPPPLPMAA